MTNEVDKMSAASRGSASDEVIAGIVPCGPLLYEVTCTHGHKTLRRGDLVRMLEDTRYHNVLLRTDWTLHALEGEHGQYVHLRLLPMESRS